MLAHVQFACAWVEQRNAFNSVGAAIAPVVVVHFILTNSATGAAHERGVRRDHHRQRGRRRDSAALRLDRGQAGIQLCVHHADSLLPVCFLLRNFRVQAAAKGAGIGQSRPGTDYG